MPMMHEQINFIGSNTIKVKWDDFPHFTFPLHYHSELEIVYVIKSFGKRYVGDSIEDFSEGDLVLLGSNLPHFWKNDDRFHQGNPDYFVNAVVIQFPESLFGEMVDLPEFNNIGDLLIRAQKGVHFPVSEANVIGESLRKLIHLQGLNRYIELVKILEMMSTVSSYRLLSKHVIKSTIHKGADSRLHRVLNYLRYNYTTDVKLSYLAKQAGMNITAFCRFFKERTNQTVMEYVHEMRIGFACKLIMEGSKTVSEVAFQCGFNNVSNFKRIFKRVTGFTPSAYKREVK